MGMYTEMLDTITAYTGLSPPAFFTILAASVFVYNLVSNMFVSPVHDNHNNINTTTTTFKKHNNNSNTNNSNESNNAYVVREPVQLGDDVSEEELRGYDGSDSDKPLLMAIKGMIYDVSRSRMFYGPGGSYALFAGRDASRALALMSFEPKHLTSNIEGLSPSELEVLQDWEYKFMEKYVKVGQLASAKKHPDPVENDDQISRNAEENGEQGEKVPFSE